jgi:hypothetical protein
MARVFAFTAWLLLILWLPATQHCALGESGLVAPTCGGGCSQGPTEAPDLCSTVEAGAYRPAANILRASAPDLSARPCHVVVAESSLAAFSAQVVFPATVLERPREWTATWHFVRRAAPAPRAPAAMPS